jgi:hypothetical protein
MKIYIFLQDEVVDEKNSYFEQNKNPNVVNKIGSLMQSNFDNLDNRIDKKKIVSLSVEEIMSPISTCNLENSLREKSLILNQNALMEIYEELSDSTSSLSDDEYESFHNQFNLVFGIKPSNEGLDKTMSSHEILGFQSQIQFNPIFEHNQNISKCGLNDYLQNQDKI